MITQGRTRESGRTRISICLSADTIPASEWGFGFVSVERNKATIRRFVDEVRNRGRFEVIDEITAPHLISDMQRTARGLHAAFDRYSVELLDLVGDGDTVVLRGMQRGVQKGPWLGLPASGKSVQWMVLRLFTFDDAGKITATWAFSDSAGLIAQMGGRIVPVD